MTDEPNPPGKAEVLRWLGDFQKAIQHEDYPAGRRLFHQNVVAFGTSVNRADSLDYLEERQWKDRWPRNHHFQYLIQTARVVPSPGMFVVAVEWKCPSSLIVRRPPRSGRATIVLADFEGKLLCVHSHHSEDVE